MDSKVKLVIKDAIIDTLVSTKIKPLHFESCGEDTKENILQFINMFNKVLVSVSEQIANRCINNIEEQLYDMIYNKNKNIIN